MVFIFLLFSVVQARSGSLLPPPPLLPPQDVHVDNWELTWTPTTQDVNVTYNVQYSTRFEVFTEIEWNNVRACQWTSSNSCDVRFTKDEAEYGCVMLQVQANGHGKKSEPINACSTHSDSCTPEVNLTAYTRSLTVRLSKNHQLHQEYADNIKHRIFFGKEGESPEEYDSGASMTIDDLEPGQRYCVRVQYVYMGEPVGLSTCPICEVIPPIKLKQSDIIIVVVVGVLFLVVLITLTAYILIFRLGKIKEYLKLPCAIPTDFHERFGDWPGPMFSSRPPPEEICDIISSMTPVKAAAPPLPLH